jgi:cell wall-associated NlpC family hydrolase
MTIQSIRWRSLAGLFLIVGLLSACAPLPQQSQNASVHSQQNYHDPRRLSINHIAHQQLGVRYKWGGTSPKTGFDCSGYTQYVYEKSGIKIPRTAAQQRDASQRISHAQLQVGDLIFFKTGARSNHVGIYIGNGKFIQAGSGNGRVKIERLDNPYWKKRWVKYGSYLL